MRFLSLFSGIGGFDLALERAGMECVGHSEIDKAGSSILKRHWPKVKNYGDITKIDTNNLPDVQLICGGFPCQDLSVAGKRAGLAGERSGLFHEFIRVTRAKAPRWVFIENVPGLLSSNDGRDMGTVTGALAELGYRWAYRLLDSQYFGLAQRRRRVWIVGCLGRPASAAKVLFEPESVCGDTPPRNESRERIADSLTVGANQYSGLCGEPVEVARPLKSGGNLRHDESHDTYITTTHEVSPAIQERGGKGPDSDCTQAYVMAFTQNQCGDVLTGEIAASMGTNSNATGRNTPKVMNRSGVRRLTPLECERLQGFPDDWTATGDNGKQIADAPRYRSLGNAAPVPVVEWIGKRIMREIA